MSVWTSVDRNCFETKILILNVSFQINVDVALSTIHTKNDNYNDNDISVHTSKRYRLLF